MKKNRMMRVASVLLVAVLLTTSAISGTFAKYVTQASNRDEARVAKFGVVVTAEGSLFEHEYDVFTGDSGNTVIRSDSGDVVAPGTANTNGMSFSVSGRPEVTVQISFNATKINDVVLPKSNSYRDYTNGNDANATFNLDADYYPIRYTLSDGNGVLTQGNLDTIVAYLNNPNNWKTIAPNQDLSTNSNFGTYTLTWAWDFPATPSEATDKADTFLGQLAAFGAYNESTNPSGVSFPTGITEGDVILNAGIEIEIIVTQVD